MSDLLDIFVPLICYRIRFQNRNCSTVCFVTWIKYSIMMSFFAICQFYLLTSVLLLNTRRKRIMDLPLFFQLMANILSSYNIRVYACVNTIEASNLFYCTTKASINLYIYIWVNLTSAVTNCVHIIIYTYDCFHICKINTPGIKSFLYWEEANHCDNNFRKVFPYGNVLLVHDHIFSSAEWAIFWKRFIVFGFHRI